MASTAGGAGADKWCPRCGAPVGPNPRYCPRCGSPQAAATPQSSYAPPPPAAPQYQPQIVYAVAPKSGVPWWRLAAVFVLALCVGLGALFALSPDFRGYFVGAVTPSCSVGLNGAAVRVTVQGADAQAQCDSMLTQTTDGGTWYVYSGGQQPAGASICQVHYAGDLFTVRDQGSLNLYGTSICSRLVDLANGIPPPTPTSAPTRKPVFTPISTAACGLQVEGHNATVLADLPVCNAFGAAYPPADGTWIKYAHPLAPSGDSLVCEGYWTNAHIEIWDSGGRSYATDLCRRLGW